MHFQVKVKWSGDVPFSSGQCLLPEHWLWVGQWGSVPWDKETVPILTELISQEREKDNS